MFSLKNVFSPPYLLAAYEHNVAIYGHRNVVPSCVPSHVEWWVRLLRTRAMRDRIGPGSCWDLWGSYLGRDAEQFTIYAYRERILSVVYRLP